MWFSGEVAIYKIPNHKQQNSNKFQWPKIEIQNNSFYVEMTTILVFDVSVIEDLNLWFICYLVLVIWDFKLTSIDPFLFHENQAFTVAHQLYPAQAGGSLDLGFLP